MFQWQSQAGDRLLEFGAKPYLIDDRIVTRSVYFVDPEGNGIEYTVDMLTNWRDYRNPGAKWEHRPYMPGQETPETQSFVNPDPEYATSMERRHTSNAQPAL